MLKKIAKIAFEFHTNMLDVNRVLNLFGIISDDKHEQSNKTHVMKSLECLEIMGYDLSCLKKDK